LNLFSLNLLVRDTPAFYTPGRGPKVSWDLTFNSHDPGSETSPFNYLFGPHVSCPYQTHVVDLGNDAHVVMPDGREDWYSAVDPAANPVVYNPASGTGIFNKLTKDKTADLFRLELKDHSVLTFAKKFTSGGTTYYAVTKIADGSGDGLTLAYNADPVPKLVSLTDANGAVSQLAYNAAGHASQVQDPFGPNAQFSYTNVAGADRLSAITDQASYTSLLAYDTSGRLVSITTPMTVPDPTWQFAYSGTTDRISSITGPEGGIRSYSTTATTTTITDELGRQTTYDFSNNGFGGPGRVTDGLGAATQRQFDANRNPTRVINRRGYFSDSTFDSRGNRLTERRYKNPFPDTSQFVDRSWTYDARDNVLSATDSMGTESWTYNAHDEILTYTDKLGHTTSNTYDAHGKLLTVTDRNGIVAVTNTYDANGRLSTMANALGNTISFEWDARGRRSRSTDPTGAATSFAYDLLDRVTVVTFPDLTTTQNTYNCCTLTQTVDQNGGVTQFVYDKLARLTRKTDPTGAIVQQAYDAVGNLVSATDPNSHTWQWQYDALNRKAREIDPLANQRTWLYDAEGNITRRVDGKGAITDYSYDAFNQRTLTSYPDATTVAVAYDDVGNRLTVDDAVGHWAWTYDALSRMTSELTPMAASPTQYQYDNEGHRTRLTDPDGNQTVTEYNAAYGVSTVRFPLGMQTLSVAYQRDSRGLMTERVLPNGVRSTYNYDSLGRPTTIEHRRADTTLLFQFAHQYDAAGNLTRETSQRWDIGLGTTVPHETQYRYNARHELTGEKYFLSGIFILDLDYSYDLAGNRSRKITTNPTTPNSPITIDYSYRSDNQIASSLRTAPLDPPHTTNYSEDANGNLTQEAAPSAVTTYSYDFEDKLRRVDLPTGSNEQFRHSPDGLRVERIAPGGGVTRYVLDSLQVQLEKDSAGSTQVRYVPQIGRIVAGQIGYYAEDRLGSVIGLVDSSQSVSDTFRFDAWGLELQRQGGTSTPYRYIGLSGYYFEPAIDLHLLGQRHMSAKLGRFLTRDLWGRLSMEITGPNVYIYVRNSPTRLTDPDGLVPCAPWPLGCGPGAAACSHYLTAGFILCCGLAQALVEFGVCMAVPAGPWANCVRACLQRCEVVLRPTGCMPRFAACHAACFASCAIPPGIPAF